MSRIDIHSFVQWFGKLERLQITILVPAEVVNVKVMTTQGYTSTITNLEMTKPGQLQYLSCSKSSKTSWFFIAYFSHGK